MKARENTHEETKHAPEPDSSMTQMLELWDLKFKLTTMNILRALMIKVDNMQEMMGRVNGDGTLRRL